MFILIWFGLCFVPFAIARARGRSLFAAIGLFFVSLVLSPLLGVIIALCLRNLAKARSEQQQQQRHHELVEAVRDLGAPRASLRPMTPLQLPPNDYIEMLRRGGA